MAAVSAHIGTQVVRPDFFLVRIGRGLGVEPISISIVLLTEDETSIELSAKEENGIILLSENGKNIELLDKEEKTIILLESKSIQIKKVE